MSAYTYELVKENNLLPARFENVCCPAQTVTAHWHEYLEILFIVSGRMTAVIQAETYELFDGDILIINSKDIHMTQTHGRVTNYLLLQISAKQLRHFFTDFSALRFATRIPGQKTSRDSSDPAVYLNEMLQIYEMQEDGYPLLFTARLYDLLYCLYRNHSRQTASDREKAAHRDFSRISRIMEWVRSHYREQLSLDEAAGYLGLSREYFCRIFKKYTGQTFLEYLNDVRVMELYKELTDSDETVTNLMEKHGITNYKVFLRTFKKLYGETPQKMRKRGHLSSPTAWV